MRVCLVNVCESCQSSFASCYIFFEFSSFDRFTRQGCFFFSSTIQLYIYVDHRDLYSRLCMRKSCIYM